MNSRTIQQVTIDKLTHEGRGLAYIDGKPAFIDGALPGETVNIKIRKKKSKYLEGFVTEIRQASEDRITPPCPHYWQCGGCQLQHMGPNDQLNLKQTTLLEHLQQYGLTQPKKILSPITGPYWGYRRKARLGAKYVAKKGRLLLGFREKHNPGYINDNQTCLVLTQKLGPKIDWLADRLNQTSIRDAIPQIEVSDGDDGLALIIRHLAIPSNDDLTILTAIGKESGCKIYLQPGKPDTMHKLYPKTSDIEQYYELPNQNIKLYFHPLDFIQINSTINQKLVTKALELLEIDNSDQVLDLFCGLGNFSLPMAQKAQSVIGIEGDADMVERAQNNAEINRIDNARFQTGDLDSLKLSPSLHANKVLLDPPRTGAENAVLELIEFLPERILYISCNSATLARDAGHLVHKYYTMSAAGVVDMFPHTRHVECIALFERRAD